MRIGIGIPCYIDDIPLLFKYTLSSINRLNPKPDVVYCYLNRGVDGGKGELRKTIFDILFNTFECDVVLNIDVDFILFSDILKHIKEDIVVSFGYIVNTPIVTLSLLIKRYISNKPFTGCYSIPRKIWFDVVKDSDGWDGSDYGVKLCLNDKYHVVKRPKYMIMRRNTIRLKQVVLFHPYAENMNILRKCIRLLIALEI